VQVNGKIHQVNLSQDKLQTLLKISTGFFDDQKLELIEDDLGFIKFCEKNEGE